MMVGTLLIRGMLIGIVAAGAGYARGVTATLIYLFIYSFMQLGAFMVIVLMRQLKKGQVQL